MKASVQFPFYFATQDNVENKDIICLELLPEKNKQNKQKTLLNIKLLLYHIIILYIICIYNTYCIFIIYKLYILYNYHDVYILYDICL